ncbi:hypothetical protein HID58_088694 [Brassica napus]|uniref:EF-hand domain-containing protein n=1 Tax=Brassica napus TaxID=3708 RepID=A0ABQ7XWW6_BRANA|nr:hypothetical protein HID58_088694 [Brassica napus]
MDLRLISGVLESSFIFSSVVSLPFGQVIAEHLSVEEVAGIKEAFEMMDSNKTGKINLEQLKHGLHKLGQQQMADADLQILMEAIQGFQML